MKIRPLLFSILCLAGQGIAQDQTQIRIETRIRSGDDVLSAPSVITLSGQSAKIEVIREIPVTLKGVKETPVATQGVTLSVTPTHAEGHILLTGKFTISEKPETHSKEKDMAYVSLRVSETTFVIKAKPGKSYQLKIPDAKKEGEILSMEITPSLVQGQNSGYWRDLACPPIAKRSIFASSKDNLQRRLVIPVPRPAIAVDAVPGRSGH